MDKPWKFTAVRVGMAALTLIYLPFVLSDAGAPEWSAPWRPSAGGAGVLAFTIVVTLALWADGWLLQAWLSRRKSRSARAATAHKFESSAFGWFLVRSSLLYSGAPAGAGRTVATPHDR
jgi:protein-S-isoprenylcysteine O-methyltransferase Ste14